MISRAYKLALGVILGVLASACATLPVQSTERALYIDARKALRAESRLGWTVDRIEIAEAAVQTEPSACHVTPERRAALRAWVDQRIAEEGGPAAEQFARGRTKSELKEAIELARTQELLAQVEQHVPADCPFWQQPEEPFEGLHTVSDRFVLIAESVGGGSLSFSNGNVEAGGGGAARVFAGYGLGTHLELALGFEAGGDAVLQKQADADGTLQANGAFRFGVPAFLRVIDLDWVYDLELAAMSRLTNGELRPMGARVALAGGVSGLRRISLMPSISIWLAYEIFPAQDKRSAEHVLRIGTKVGIDWDP
ncbi:MAG: hypothetical protein ABW352_06075 [Polyangiales bacterium]